MFKSDSILNEIVEVRRDTLQHLVSANYTSFDPFDGLNSWVGDFVCATSRINSPIYRLLRLAILQAVKRSPVNLRPLIGVRPQQNAMTLACVLLGFTHGERNQTEELNCLHGLLKLRDLDSGLWGYPFPWQARAFYVATNEPNIVISSLCLRAIISWIECSQNIEPDLYNECIAVLEKGQQSILNLFYRKNEGYFSYVLHKSVLVHNANLFGIETCLTIEALQIRNGLNKNAEMVEYCLGALDQTLDAQEESGRWAYGTKSFHQWADNFHSVYNLISLRRITNALTSLSTDDSVLKRIDQNIARGAKYYFDHAVHADGVARYYDNRRDPIESHSYAAFFIFFGMRFSTYAGVTEEHALEKFTSAWKNFREYMEVSPGHFRYRHLAWQRFFKFKGPSTLRWVEAWVFYGLNQSFKTKE